MKWIRYKPLCLSFTDNFVWEHLFDYDGTRYHAVLMANENEKDCIENKLLHSLTEALEEEEITAFDDESAKCTLLFEPYFDQQSLQVHDTNQPDKIVKVQAKTSDGVLGFFSHDRRLVVGERVEPIPNKYPQLQTFADSRIKNAEKVCYEIFKVQIEGLEGTYCLKTVHRDTDYVQILREIECLPRLKHENIVPFVGLRDAKEAGKIDGVLQKFIDGQLLSKITRASENQKKAWKSQLKAAIQYTHEQGVVWGDAKPANIVIDRQDRLVLIDFGGGYTKGWVDKELRQTVRGDWQGMGRISEFIDRIGSESR